LSLVKDAERGQQAQAVLDNPVYAEAYGLLEKGITDRWRDSRDAADREELHRQLMALMLLRSQIESVMRSGKVASAELGRKQTRAEQMTTGWQRKSA
jgi:hypothetical protein